jgi:glucose/mannose-6-phosphate isomerase
VIVDLDDAAALRAHDPAGMLEAIAAMPRHCREGYEAGTGAAGLPGADGVTAITICGMGGSAIAGDAVHGLYRGRAIVPVEVVRGPELPAYCGRNTLVICSSYSGGTAETLACFREALERGCRVIPVTSGGALATSATEAGLGIVNIPGGGMPRAAFGRLTFAILGALESVGLLPPMADDVERAAAHLETRGAAFAPDVPRVSNPAKDLAARIGERVPVIWGAAGMASVAAARWKAQCNENAKIPAWSSALPELDHNEVVGWAPGTGRGTFLIALRHEEEHPEVAARFPISLEIVRDAGAVTQEIHAEGGTMLARFLSLVLLGDFVTTYHALARAVDPTPIEAILRLKAFLESESHPG